MKKIVALVAIAVILVTRLYAGDGNRSGKNNFTTFSNDKAIITPELDSLTSKEFKSHPEYGVKPYNAPCKDCFELLQKRDEHHRYFVIAGSKGKEFCQETSYGRENYYDENKLLRSIDPRIKPFSPAGVFKAASQPMPVTINIPGKFTSILNAGKELQFNRNVTLYIKHKDGTMTSLGEPSWSDYTAGDNGVLVHNFYPGIDLQLKVQEGAIESNYKINKPLNLGDGWLVVRDNMNVPQGLSYDYSYSEKKADGNYEGMLCMNDAGATRYFVISSPAAYDENNAGNNAIKLHYKITSAGAYDLYVPIDWMNSADRSYPLIIDPLVMAPSSVPQANITGSTYNAVCFANGCQYPLAVAVPASCTITDIQYSFDYEATGVCTMDKAGFDLSYTNAGGTVCSTPVITCPNPFPGACEDDNLSCLGAVQSCLPAPQCAAAPLNFTLTFYRCIQPGGGACGMSCIIAESPWTMEVFGRTVELNSVTSDAPNNSICEGSSTNLTATASFGVPPYTYMWNPGGAGQTINVSPPSTTPYTVIATDACANTAQSNITITVFPDDNPSFTITPNPACSGSPVTVAGNPGGPPSSYNWVFVGGNPGTQSGQQTVTVTYPAAGGPNNITLQWTSPTSNCIFDNTQQINILPSPQTAFVFTPSEVSILSPTVTFTDQSTGEVGATWLWEFGDGTTSQLQNPTHPYTEPGTFTITLVVTNASGCMDSISYSIQVNNEYFVYVPNSFTPNGDGVNDYFGPQGTDASGIMPLIYTMTIYNRWGEKIFETDNSSLPWGGQANNGSKVAEAGVYVYRIEFQDPHFASKPIVGSVTLIR